MSRSKRYPLGWLYPIERLVLLMGIFTTVLYLLMDIPPRSRIDFYLEQIITACDNYAFGLALGAVVVVFLKIREQRRSAQPISPKLAWISFLDQFVTRVNLLRDLRLILAMLLTLSIFSHLKHIIPLINAHIYDQWFVESERFFLNGHVASEVTINLLGPGAASFMSWGYTAYYVYMNAIFMIFIVQRNRALAHEFCTAFALLWFLGILMVYALPTWGPCFYLPDLFKQLPATPISELQHHLWLQKLRLDLDPRNPIAVFLISGAPSLHIAVTTLGSIYLQKFFRPLGWMSWAFVALTWVTTLYFGWHYVLDNVTALGLVWLAIYASRALNPKTIRIFH